jgi:hypothetical protein
MFVTKKKTCLLSVSHIYLCSFVCPIENVSVYVGNKLMSPINIAYMHSRGGCKMFRKYSEYYSLGILKLNGLRLFHYLSHGATAPSGPGPPHCRGFTITLRHTTLYRTPLDEWSARRRVLYLTKFNNKQTSMPPARFEPAGPASERPQTHALNSAVSGIGLSLVFSHLCAVHWRALSGIILRSVEWWDDYHKPT